MCTGDQWIDVVAAAERQRCSTQTVWRRISSGVLPVTKMHAVDRSGRRVIKTMIQVRDLEAAFAPLDHERRIREIEDAAPPLTESQKAVIAAVLADAFPDGVANVEPRKRT